MGSRAQLLLASFVLDANVSEISASVPLLYPGEVLREEFMVPLGLSADRIAEACCVPRTRIERIASERLGIKGDTAVRLGKVLGTGPKLWMNLQARFETETARAALADVTAGLPELHGAA